MEKNNTILLIDEKEKEDARALTRSFARNDVKSRAYINVLGAEVCLKYLKEENISDEYAYNLHNIRKILEEFDISDIMLSNIHIDVRVVFDENQIFIPKSHFDYDITPDIYITLKITKDYSNIDILGFFEPKMINKNNTNGEYYFMEKEKLFPPVDLKNFIKNYKGIASQSCSSEEITEAEFLIVSMADNNASADDKKKLLGYLRKSAELRDKFIEFENFEMLAYNAANTIELESAALEVDVADIPTDEMSDDVVNDIESSNIKNLNDALAESNTAGDTGEQSGLIGGAAALGAGIAGSAAVSAALSGTEEAAETAEAAAGAAGAVSDVIGDAANTVTLDETEKSLSIQDMSVEALGEEPLLPNIEDMTQSGTGFAAAGLSNINFTKNSPGEDNQDTGSFDGNLEDFFGSADENPENAHEEPSNEEPVFMDSDNSDEIIFENNDDYAYESSGGISSASQTSSSPAASSGKPIIPPVSRTPISEATELVSLDDVQKENVSPANIENQGDMMETMEMDEFNTLVDNYVHEEIKDESPTVDLNTIPSKQIAAKTSIGTAEGEADELADMNSMPEERASVEVPVERYEEDGVFEENLPDMGDLESSADNSALLKKDDLTSDDFVEDISGMDSSSQAVEKPSVNPAPEGITPIESEALKEENNLVEQELSEDGVALNFTEKIPMVEPSIFEGDIQDILSDEVIPESFESAGSVVDEKAEPVNSQVSDRNLETQDMNISEEDLSILDELSGADDITVSDDSDLSSASEPAGKVKSIAIDGMIPTSIPELSAGERIPNIALNDMQFDDPADNSVSQPADVTDIPSYDEIPDIEIYEGPNQQNTDSEDKELGLLYTGSTPPRLNTSDIEQLQNGSEDKEYYDNVVPQNKAGKLMPVFALLAAIVIAGTVAGFLIKDKNSIDAETLIQSSPENEVLATPEADNSNILANTSEASVSPSPTGTQNTSADKQSQKDAVKEMKDTLKQPSAKKPINGSKTVTIKNLSWGIPDYLSYSDNIKKYLQTAGKSIKLVLSSDLLLTNEYIYSNQVKVNLKLSKDGTIQNAEIDKSSGSDQIDKIVLQTVKDTLSVVKPPQGEVPTPNYSLTLTIYL